MGSDVGLATRDYSGAGDEAALAVVPDLERERGASASKSQSPSRSVTSKHRGASTLRKPNSTHPSNNPLSPSDPARTPHPIASADPAAPRVTP
jgi:hypothetical protein